MAGPPGGTRSRARVAVAEGLNRAVTKAASLRCPILVQGGEHDSVAPPAVARKVAWEAKGLSELREYPCGHFGYLLELRDRVIADQLHFLRRHLAATEPAHATPNLRGMADVGEAEFQQQVVERSHEVPVVVDFWAEWCGPCRTLGPALEKAVAARGGRVELAKVDTEANQGLARPSRSRAFPRSRRSRTARSLAEFVGAIPPAAIEQFLDELAPSEAEEPPRTATRSRCGRPWRSTRATRPPRSRSPGCCSGVARTTRRESC